MAQRIRGHQTNSGSTRDSASLRNSTTSSSISSSGSTAVGAEVTNGKRKRDVLQDISEEHGSLNAESSSRQQQQQQHASATSTRRSQHAPRRPSPMAPTRRASVRRSRRLSEQQPSASSGRAGTRAAAASTASASKGGDKCGNRGVGGSGGEEEVADRDDDGGMSCDEDLEGTVVDLRFEGVADDAVWRESRSGSSAPSSSSTSRAGGRGVAGGKCARNVSRSSGEADPDSISDDSTGSQETGRSSARNIQQQHHQQKPDPRGKSVGDDRSCATRRGREERSASTSVKKSRSTVVHSHPPRGAAGAAAAAADPLASSGRCNGGARGQPENSARDVEVDACGDSVGPGGEKTLPCTDVIRRKSAAAVAAKAAAAAAVAAAGVRTPLPAGVEDIDARVSDEAEAHLLNPDYVVEHAEYLRVQEKRNRPGAYIGGQQKDMRPSMRSVLVDWIVEVCDQFKLSSRTLFQVVDLIDRSLTAFEVPRGRLQLLGCACVVLASKYEEIYAPTAEELAHISDNTYTRGEIIAMELVVVNALQFRLTCITPCNFVDRFCRAAGSNHRERSLVTYLLELLLQDYQGVTLLPSLKTAAALYLARQTLHPKGCPREAWTKQTEHYTGYSPRALEACVRRLHSLHVRAEVNNLHAVRDKYAKTVTHRVAETTCALEDALHFGGDEA